MRQRAARAGFEVRLVVFALAGSVAVHVGCDVGTTQTEPTVEATDECAQALAASTGGPDVWEVIADEVVDDEEFADSWGDEAYLERVERTEAWAAEMNRTALQDLVGRCSASDADEGVLLVAVAERKRLQMERRRSGALRAQHALERLQVEPAD